MVLILGAYILVVKDQTHSSIIGKKKSSTALTSCINVGGESTCKLLMWVQGIEKSSGKSS